MGLMNDVRLYKEILVDEICRIGLIRENASNARGSQKDVIRFLLQKEIRNCFRIQEVEFCASPREEIGIAKRGEAANEGRSYKSAMSCDIYFCGFFHHRYNPKLL